MDQRIESFLVRCVFGYHTANIAKLLERDLRMCNDAISAEGVAISCAGQRIHQCGSVAGLARLLNCALGVIARSRRITTSDCTTRSRRHRAR